MRRGVAGAFVAALVLATVLAGAGAQAAPGPKLSSTTCSFVGVLTFKPALHQGENDFAFIKLAFRFKNCAGATVTSGGGPGGSQDTLTCQDGQVTSQEGVGSKLVINWDTAIART